MENTQNLSSTETNVTNPSPLSPKPKSKLPTILGAVILVVIIVMGVILLIHKHDQNKANNTKVSANVAFVINGQSYTKSQVQQLTELPVSTGTTSAAAAKLAYGWLKNKAVAQKEGVVLPQSSLNAEVTSLDQTLLGNTKSAAAKSWVNLVAYNNTLQEYLQSQDGYTPAQGYVFYMWFNQHEQYGPATIAPSGNGNATLIAQDRSYAQSQATKYQAELKANKISPQQLIKDINNDPKLNQSYTTGNTNNGSVQFGNSSSEGWQAQVNNSQVISNIESQKSTGVGSVEVGQSIGPTVNGKQTSEDALFYFTDLTKLPNKLNTTTKFNNLVTNLPSHYYGI